MIPRHRPPYDIRLVVGSLLAGERHTGINQIEEEFTERFGVAYAVWLPSVRAGILWSIRIVAGPDSRVIGPAFTCEHVHEAMAASGSSWELVDSATDGFLMDGDGLRSVARSAGCTVFCEVFGHTYDLAGPLANSGTFRIVDMAVTVPNRPLLGRLADRDIALVSFGAGKCMTAGWGAVAFTRNRDLASELKSLRDSSLEAETGRLRFTRITKILVQTSMYSRVLYGPARRLHDVRSGSASFGGRPNHNGPDGPSAGYWHLPSTRLDRNLIHHNLGGAEAYESKRLADARRYRSNLVGSSWIRVPPCSDNALSHFTIRVSSDHRDQIRRCLWRAGIDAGTYFAFPPFLSKDIYPNANRLASEVLNLPLGEGLDLKDIDRISEVLIRCADDHQN